MGTEDVPGISKQDEQAAWYDRVLYSRPKVRRRRDTAAELERLAAIADAGLPSTWRGQVKEEVERLIREEHIFRGSPALATLVIFQQHLSRWMGSNNVKLFEQARNLAASAASAGHQLRDVLSHFERLPPDLAERIESAVALFQGLHADFEREAAAVAEPRSRGRPEQKELRAFALLVREQWHEQFGFWPSNSDVASMCEIFCDPDLLGRPSRWFPSTRDQRRAAVVAILQGKKEKRRLRSQGIIREQH
jgi:hypothetical protein